jgi:hypothetical protein
MVKLWLAMTAGLLELAGFVFREVEYLVDEIKEMGPRGKPKRRNDNAIYGDGQGHQGLRGWQDAVRGAALGYGEVQRGDGV